MCGEAVHWSEDKLLLFTWCSNKWYPQSTIYITMAFFVEHPIFAKTKLEILHLPVNLMWSFATKSQTVCEVLQQNHKPYVKFCNKITIFHFLCSFWCRHFNGLSYFVSVVFHSFVLVDNILLQIVHYLYVRSRTYNSNPILSDFLLHNKYPNVRNKSNIYLLVLLYMQWKLTNHML